MGIRIIALLIFLVSCAGAQAEYLGKYGILYNDDGTMKMVTWAQAKEECPVGYHLPQARYFAGHFHGAHPAIVEPSQYDSDEFLNKENYHPIERAGEIEFYYLVQNYNPPAGDLGSHEFWTLSLDPQGGAYVFEGINGLIRPAGTENGLAVLCVRN